MHENCGIIITIQIFELTQIMPPKKSTTRKQAKPKSNKKTEEQKLEEDVAKTVVGLQPPVVDDVLIMPTRSRSRKTIIKKADSLEDASASRLNLVKTRDQEEHHKSQHLEEGEEDADELPSRNDQISHKDSGLSSNSRKMKTRSQLPKSSSDKPQSSTRDKPKKSSTRKPVDQAPEDKKQPDQDLIQDERPSVHHDDLQVMTKKSTGTNQRSRSGKKQPGSSTVSVKVKQTDIPPQDQQMAEVAQVSSKDHHNNQAKDPNTEEDKQLPVASDQQVAAPTKPKSETTPQSAQKSIKKSTRKSDTARKSEPAKAEDVLFEEAMNADTVQMQEVPLTATADAIPQVAEFMTDNQEAVPAEVIQQSTEDLKEAELLARNSKQSSRRSENAIQISNDQPNPVPSSDQGETFQGQKPSELIQSKKSTKPRKSDTAQPAPEQPFPSKVQALTEEEIRAKYAENSDFLEWEPRAKRYRVELEKALNDGLPKIFPSELELEIIANDFSRLSNIRVQIDESFSQYRLKNIEPSGDGNFEQGDFEAVFSDDEVKRNLFKLIAFKVEGSPLNLKELTQLCQKSILTEHFPQLSESLLESHVESLLSIYAERLSYGIKGKNPRTFTDKTPLALWSWKVTDDELLSPISETQLKKARTQRMLVGKKLTHLHQFLELCGDFQTFDSSEKVSKLNQEFEFYTKYLSKENSSEWRLRKRRHHEVLSEDGNFLPPASSKGNKASQHAKKMKLNDEPSEFISIPEASASSEMPQLNEKSEASGILSGVKKSNVNQIQQQSAIEKTAHSLENYFKKTQKSNPNENLSQLLLRRPEELKKNPFISFTARCQTESMKLRQAFSQLPSDLFDPVGILNRFKVLRDQDMQAFAKQRHSQLRAKYIQVHDSGIHYPGIIVDKQSRILNCKAPFRQDPSIIDYLQDSDEEYEEIHGENLEDDEAVEEEMQEVEEDELNLPNAGVSNEIKQRMAFRSQYNFQTLQYKEDDPELREEGFIVADDYFSQDSEFAEQEVDSDDKIYKSRRDLILKTLEQQERRTHSTTMRPYIFFQQRQDLSDFKAVSLKKKPKVVLSRMSFGAASTGDESVNLPFPLSVEKVKKNEEVKLRVNDVIADIISFSHATQLSKKQLIEDIKGKYPELKKRHVDTFVKECFEKQRRPADSKTRLFAINNVVDKYGGTEELIQQLPQIYQEKLAEEKEKMASEQASLPPQVQASSRQSEVGVQPSSTEEMPPPPSRRQSSRPRPSNAAAKSNSGVTSRKSVKSATDDQRLSHLQHAVQNVMSEGQAESQVAQSSNIDHMESGLQNYQSIISDTSAHREDAAVPQAEQHENSERMEGITQSRDEHNLERQVTHYSGLIEQSEVMNQDENSWIHAQNPPNVETPAFNSKLYDVRPNEEAEETLNHEFDPRPSALHHSQSQSFYEEPQIQLSQHAIIHHEEEQKQVEIVDQAFQRSNQQNQSTPIHNFRTLRSREISVNHSQSNLTTTLINNMMDEGDGGRQRSDSMETDRGNPMENMPPMTNLDSHLELIAGAEIGLDGGEINNRSFESPPSLNNTKMAFKNLGVIAEQNAPYYEESKEIVNIHNITDDIQGAFMLGESGQVFIIEDRSQMTSNQAHSSQSNLQETQRKRVARGSTVRGEDGTESKSMPRRSMRLESKHKILQMDLQHQESVQYLDQDDELNRAQSQQSHLLENASKRLSRHRPPHL